MNKGKHTPPRWWRLNLPLFLKKKRNSLCSLICSTWELETSGCSWGGGCKIEWGEMEIKSRLEIGHKSVMVR